MDRPLEGGGNGINMVTRLVKLFYTDLFGHRLPLQGPFNVLWRTSQVGPLFDQPVVACAGITDFAWNGPDVDAQF